MNNKLILNNKEYTLNDGLAAQLIEAITKEDEVESGRWVPEGGEYYWVVDSRGIVCTEQFYTDSSADEFRVSQGAVFKTQVEAQNHLTYLKALATIKEDAEWWEPTWDNDNDQGKFSAYYDHGSGELMIEENTWSQGQGVIFFETQEKLEESFKTHRVEWLCVLGISEEDK